MMSKFVSGEKVYWLEYKNIRAWEEAIILEVLPKKWWRGQTYIIKPGGINYIRTCPERRLVKFPEFLEMSDRIKELRPK